MNKRFVAALVGVTMITLVLAFAWVFNSFNASQEQQLDEALVAEAHEEAREIAQAGTDRLQISARPGPTANDVGPLTKYAAIYDVDGGVLDRTATFRTGAPALGSLPAELDVPFDLGGAEERLRAVRVAIPDRSGDTLLLAAPRTDLDGDARLLAGAMAIVYTVVVGLTVLAITFLVNRFTRLHRRVASVTRRVAQGDLGARVGVSRGAKESVRLARDLDETIARLETLVSSQQRFVASAAHEIRSPLTALY